MSEHNNIALKNANPGNDARRKNQAFAFLSSPLERSDSFLLLGMCVCRGDVGGQARVKSRDGGEYCDTQPSLVFMVRMLSPAGMCYLPFLKNTTFFGQTCEKIILESLIRKMWQKKKLGRGECIHPRILPDTQ